jgi:hypothetical protein
MTQKFADMIRADAARELLNVRSSNVTSSPPSTIYDGTTTSSCSPKWWPSSGRPSTCAPCSNSAHCLAPGGRLVCVPRASRLHTR